MDYVPAWELLYFLMEQSKLYHKFTSILLYNITADRKIFFFSLDMKENLCKDGFMAMVYFGELTE